MGLFSKVVDTVKDVYNGTIGDIINPSNIIVGDLTGLSNTDQLSVGALGGTANALLGGAGEGSLISNLFGANGAFSTVANGLFNGISSLGSNLLNGAASLFGDYFSLAQQWKYQKQAMQLQDTFNKQAEQRQYNYNLKTMAQQNKYNISAENRAMQNNIKLWNMQNEYNMPAAQMQRLTDAGLNPNLAYGSANTTAGAISTPGSHGVSAHGVSTRATKALVRQAMSLNYQQIVSNQLQNAMMAEQIADRRANRALSVEQFPLDMAYKQAQIDAIKNGYSFKNAELGLHHSDNVIRQQEIAEMNAWRKYQDDLRLYEANLKEARKGPYGLGKYAEEQYKKTHRRPMYMDYL